MCRQEGKAEGASEQEAMRKRQEKPAPSETWPRDAQDELLEFIEQQGIYIRQ